MKYIILSLMILASCASTPEKTPSSSGSTERIALWWENTSEKHPERIPWTNELTTIIESDLDLYKNSEDFTDICPKFKSLPDRQKVKAIGQFWNLVFYFESGFNPKSNSVDVGTVSNLGSYSVGLGQMSADDGAAKKFGATFKTLQEPIMNIRVSLEQMRRQLKNTGEVFLPNASTFRYWAVILVGNFYSKIEDYQEIDKNKKKYGPFKPGIKTRMKTIMPECV